MGSKMSVAEAPGPAKTALTRADLSLLGPLGSQFQRSWTHFPTFWILRETPIGHNFNSAEHGLGALPVLVYGKDKTRSKLLTSLREERKARID